MSDVVFILGAGASTQAGAPVMANFLDVAENLLKKGNVSNPKDFKSVLDARGSLQATQSKANLDIQNIESVFAALEMAHTLGGYSGYSVDDIDGLIKSIKRMIAETIERTLLMPLKGKSRPPIPEPYGDFAALVEYLQEEAQPLKSVAVMTFNYDIAVDYALESRCLIKYDYRLDDKFAANSMPLLKFHGSLNWAVCSKCNS